MNNSENINLLLIALNLIAGLVIFIFGVSNMSEGLKGVGTERMKVLLGKTTNNIFVAILVGIIITTLLQSSSATIIMLIAMVNAQLLTSRQSLGVILGSNIGTTIISQIIAYNIGEYAAVPLIIGLIIFLTFKTEKAKHIGKSILGMGLIFFGLQYIGQSAEPLKNLQSFTTMMTQIQNPYWGAFVGAITTLIIQASSATIGITLSLANQGLITLPGAIAVMLGAEIGTCFDTLMASVGRSREALRAGVFHLFFNMVSVFAGIILINPLVKLILFISGEAPLARQIANGHVIFNIFGVLLFVGFVPLISKVLLKIIPDKK
ncbi:MAG: Na/Pi symporter [Bacteroidota bacterium]|nr:Na/Pi symporter [Bacteroidota bacterium]